MEREAYLKQREGYIDAEREGARLFDRSIITLAGGAFAISLAFLKDIAPEPKICTLWLLGVSWGGLVLSILSTLISFLTSQEACSKYVDLLDKLYLGKIKEIGKIPLAKLTRGLNWFSIGSFLVGIFFLVVFSIMNM